MSVTRRQFLATAGVVGVSAIVAPYLKFAPSSANQTGTIFRAGHFKSIPDMLRRPFCLASEVKTKNVFQWNIETGKAETIPTETVIHVVESHPLDSNLSVLATKRTDQMSMFDWKLKKEISHHRFLGDRFFYGHAAFSTKGDFLITSVHQESRLSQIAIFEVPTLKLVEVVDVPHGFAHEMSNMGSDQFLFGIGSTPTSAVSFGVFDLATKQIKFFATEFEKTDRTFALSHLKFCGDRYIANVNLWELDRSLDGAVVSFHPRTHEVKTEIPLGSMGLKSELLSFEFDPSTNYAWVTLPGQHEIKVWNITTDTLVKTLSFDKSVRPTALSYVPSLNLAIVTTAHQFFAFDSKTLARREQFESKTPNWVLYGGYAAHSRLV